MTNDAPHQAFHPGDILKRRTALIYVRVLDVRPDGLLFVAPYRPHPKPGPPPKPYLTDPDYWEPYL